MTEFAFEMGFGGARPVIVTLDVKIKLGHGYSHRLQVSSGKGMFGQNL